MHIDVVVRARALVAASSREVAQWKGVARLAALEDDRLRLCTRQARARYLEV